jgi:hypothetical protein
MNQGEVR